MFRQLLGSLDPVIVTHPRDPRFVEEACRQPAGRQDLGGGSIRRHAPENDVLRRSEHLIPRYLDAIDAALRSDHRSSQTRQMQETCGRGAEVAVAAGCILSFYPIEIADAGFCRIVRERRARPGADDDPEIRILLRAAIDAVGIDPGHILPGDPYAVGVGPLGGPNRGRRVKSLSERSRGENP